MDFGRGPWVCAVDLRKALGFKRNFSRPLRFKRGHFLAPVRVSVAVVVG